MKKLNIICAALATLACCASCRKEVHVIYEQNTPVRKTVTPALSLQADQSSETKSLSYGISSPAPASPSSLDTKAGKTTAELLSDGYVFQFNSGGLMLAKESFSLVPGEVLRPHLVTGLGQTIYVFANCSGLNLASVKDLASFEAFTFPVDAIQSDDDIPYVGCAKGVNIEEAEDGSAKLSLSDGSPVSFTLKRIVSKIELSYSFNVDGIALESISIVDAPSSIPFVEPSADGEMTFYPEAILESNFMTEERAVEGEGAKSGTMSWYIADNIRGAIPEFTSEKDKNVFNAPAKSTYVRFNGKSTSSEDIYHYSVYPGGDVTGDYNIRRGNIYDMTVSISGNGSSVDNRIEVITPPAPPVVVIHQYADPANCYVVKPGEEVVIGYRMGADGKKNAYTSGAAVADAVIVWQTKEDGALALGQQSEVFTFSHDDELDDDLLTVKTAAEGNALVAVRDASGTILWSWHIWVTGYDPETQGVEYNGNVWMDRSLGALARDRGEARTEGWLYQWGRKDPFPPIDWLEVLEEGSINHAIQLYDGTGALLPDVDTSVGDTQVEKMPVGTADSNLAYSIAHPLTFIYNPDASESSTASYCIHWVSSVQGSDAIIENLWRSGTKTVWDPCPAGWTVASTNFYSNDPPKHNSLTYTASAISNVGAENPQERGDYLNVLDNKTLWFPFQGYRRCTKNGATFNCGDVAVFWTNNNQDACRTWAMKFRSADMRTMVTYPRSNGLCVRCVKM